MEIDRKKNFRFVEWEPESGTFDSGNTDSEGKETSILGISCSELHNEFFSAVLKSYAKHKQFHQGKSCVNSNIEHTSHSCLTPNPVTSTNIGSPVPSNQTPHHLIILQPSDG
ncbi:hypothetical protein O181_093151 [Austropuccinia psidii MF-1]|uniref:Uncharacterized protein n=1 Tax=Austropuccinia psidii MF-1 TaxID=1389203 RepID=A0A9Q3J0Q5_9BASI|nr:hypothetical protein [Austropuccinia psidii MF-1]